jgi:hypothetical protein
VLPGGLRLGSQRKAGCSRGRALAEGRRKEGGKETGKKGERKKKRKKKRKDKRKGKSKIGKRKISKKGK